MPNPHDLTFHLQADSSQVQEAWRLMEHELEFVTGVLRTRNIARYLQETTPWQRALYMQWYGQYRARQRTDMPRTGTVRICFDDDEPEYPEVDYARDITDDEPTIDEAWAALEQYKARKG